MKIREFYQWFPLTLSFEVFPPKTEGQVTRLHGTLEELQTLEPAFISVTFRPDRTSRDLTFQIAAWVRHHLGIEAMAHFTCIGASQEVIRRDLDMAHTLGLENILALRGDPPGDLLSADSPQGDFRYARELVAFIKAHYDFGIGVAGYPEGHIECPNRGKDLEHLKRKVEAGGEFIITQLFFDNRYFYDFVERARRIGIHVPIIPGILPILNMAQVKRFSALCGATLPPDLLQALNRLGENEADVQKLGVEYATWQCYDLLKQGVQGLHFYCLNRSASVRAIFQNLGLTSRTIGQTVPLPKEEELAAGFASLTPSISGSS
jgi:methylenetetrahydrofolate reductase (NADPH)